jgi:hypothetical protein
MSMSIGTGESAGGVDLYRTGMPVPPCDVLVQVPTVMFEQRSSQRKRWMPGDVDGKERLGRNGHLEPHLGRARGQDQIEPAI